MPYWLYLPCSVVNMKSKDNDIAMKRRSDTAVNSNCNFEIKKRKDRKVRHVLKSDGRRKPMLFLKRLFGLSVTVNIVFMVSLAYLLITTLQKDKPLGFCDMKSQDIFINNFNDNTNPFCDLSLNEIHSVMKFIYHKAGVGVSIENHNHTLSSTFIYSIELNTPSKTDVLNFLDKSSNRPGKEAKVVIFNGNTSTVDEYVIGRVDQHWSKMYIVGKNKKRISYKVRQPTYFEIWDIHLALKSYKSLHQILNESYGATLHSCADKRGPNHCLVAFTSYIPVVYHDKRMVWIMFYYDKEFYTLHPTDFQLLLDIDSQNTSEWKITSVWYGNKLYKSYQLFVRMYETDIIEKVRMTFPGQSGNLYGSLNFRPEHSHNEAKRAPRQVEPDGHRYRITSQTVTYLNWRFQWRNSLVRGPTLFNIQFQNERIAYEIGLQDIVTIYTGSSPAFSHASFSDAFSSLGSKSAGLVPGVDCPEHASYINVTIHLDELFVGGILPNAICIFESNLNRPLRRHSSTTLRHGGVFYGGLVASVLVFRTIFVISNYDYILDYMFYESGTMETKIYPTGYMLSCFPFSTETSYGTKVGNLTNAPMHLHLFHFKIDIDVAGTKNRYETVNIDVEPSYLQKGTSRAFKYIHKRNLKRTEKEAVYKYAFSVPKYHIIYNQRHFNKFQERRGYRVEADGFVNTLIPDKIGSEDSFPWSRYQLAVTKRKENEESSSSSYATLDAGQPIVNFEDFLKDDDAIVDKDLVLWLTLGKYHIPRAEDIPNTVTSGAGMSFTLSPFNFFDEDPSINSQDSVKITPKNAHRPKQGVFIQRSRRSKQSACVPNYGNLDSLEQDGSAIFFPYT